MFHFGNGDFSSRIIEDDIIMQVNMFMSQGKARSRNVTDWFRVVLSVDLVAGYVRAYINNGQGVHLIMDDEWLESSAQNKDGEPWLSLDEIHTDFLHLDGPLGIAEGLAVASDCESTSRLGGFAIFHSAMTDQDLRALAGPPGAPLTFLYEISHRNVQFIEGGGGVGGGGGDGEVGDGARPGGKGTGTRPGGKAGGGRGGSGGEGDLTSDGADGCGGACGCGGNWGLRLAYGLGSYSGESGSVEGT